MRRTAIRTGRTRRSREPRSGARSLAAVLIPALASLALASVAGAEDEEEEPKDWEARFAAGFNLRGGDRNEFGLNGDTTIQRNWTADTLTLRGLGDFSKTGGETTSENYGGTLDWRREVTGRFFWLSSTGVSSDPVQDRNLRVTVGSGPGYRIWQQSDKEFLDFSAGVGYRYETFRRDMPDNNFVDLRAGYVYQDKIGETLEILHSSEIYAPANEIKGFLGKSEITLSVPLIGGLFFRNNARYEYVNDPAPDKKKSNYWLTMGIEYRL